MSERIIRNDINESEDDMVVLQYLKDYNSKKCLYCFQSSQEFLCQCKDCGYYFCNNMHKKISHVVFHLKQCKHNRISLSPFNSELVCKECGMKNIFHLYFKGDKILCEDCVEKNNKSNYIKVIEDKKINEDILLSPNIPPLANRMDSYSESLFTKINNKIVSLKNSDIYTVSLNFTKKKLYCLRFYTLLDYEKLKVKEENMEEDSVLFELKFHIVDKSYITADIYKKDQDFFFYPKQVIIVSKELNENKSFLARVVNIDKSKKIVTIVFKDLDKILCDGFYNIKEKYSMENYDRMIDDWTI